MAWTTPRTWVAGEVVTAAIGNVHWRDNLNALYGGAMSITSQAALDFIYASSATQLARIAKGTASQVLRMNSGATGYEFATLVTPEGFFRGLHLRTSPNADVAATTVTLQHADAITLDDGTYVESWDDLSAVISSSGAGGLDTGSEGASRWYEIYAIRKSSDGTKNLLLHRAKDYFLDESQTTDDGTPGLRIASGAQDGIAQTFDTDVTGPCEFIDLKILKQSTPTGRMWVSIYATTAGAPTGAALKTSDKLDVSLVSTTAQVVRFIFRDPQTLTAGTTYALQIEGDYTRSSTVNIAVKQNSAGGYAAGSKYLYNGSVWAIDTGVDLWFKVYVTENDTAVTMPSGYDQKCLIGYVYNDSGSNFVTFVAHDKIVTYTRSAQATTYASITATYPFLTDYSSEIPPVPVHSVWMGITNATVLSSAGAIGVPELIEHSPVLVNCAVANAYTLVGPARAEYQGFYHFVGAGTGSFKTITSYTWT